MELSQEIAWRMAKLATGTAEGSASPTGSPIGLESGPATTRDCQPV